MTLFDFEELTTYWAEHPPLHILLGAYLGVGKANAQQIPRTLSRPCSETLPDPGSVLANLGPGFGTGDVHAGLAPVVLDFSELRLRASASD
jgi:hypothetical protein